jgi:hypothetical protein
LKGLIATDHHCKKVHPMKVLQIGAYEFESLYKDGEERLLYQGRTFFKGLAFNERVYQKVLEQLQQEGDDATACLIVEIQNSYVLWHEVKAAPLAPPAKNVDRQSLPSSESAKVQESDADLPEVETLLSTLIEQAVEKVLAKKEPSSANTSEVPPLQDTQQAPEAPPRRRRVYRGVPY